MVVGMEKPTDLRVIVQKPTQMEQFKLALPSHLTAEFFTRAFLTTLNRTPKLRECTQSSVMECLMTCAQFGLVPDGRRAHLIPIKGECKLWLGYQGLLEVILRTGEIASFTTQVVCENDEFTWTTGEIEHKINFRKPRGEPYAYYAIATRKDGTRQTEVMAKSEVDRIRSMSAGKNSDAWTNHYDEMARKTTFKRLAKWLPIASEKWNQVLQADNDAEIVAPERPSFETSFTVDTALPTAIQDSFEVHMEQYGISMATAVKFLGVKTVEEASKADPKEIEKLIALEARK